MFARQLENTITKYLFQGKIIILYGARQVGKTTLIKKILSQFSDKKTLYLNGDEENVRSSLTPKSYTNLKNLIGTLDILVIDEAQRIDQIGLISKILFDNEPNLQIILTGSSSLDLSSKISEPLTGRSLSFYLNTLSIKEVSNNGIDAISHIDKMMIYGSYPDIYKQSQQEAQMYLENLANNYLYKDLLTFEGIQKPEIIKKLLQLLAFQIGSEVSLNELANKLDIDKKTVAKYLDLLEKSFVIFTLPAFSKNIRNEINKSKKYYFYDLGIRNVLISNFLPLDIRQDIGHLFENLVILEKIKSDNYHQDYFNNYFWRNYNQKEVDFIQEKNLFLNTYEIKYSSVKEPKIPVEFANNYPNHTFKVINKNNLWEIL